MTRILVVDDDEATRDVIRDHLSETYEIIETGIPENALSMALAQQPDAILLDLAMPRISGYELCQALSSLASTQRIPILIISGEDERNKAFCQSLGASGYFTKPIDFVRLKKELEKVIRLAKPEQRADARVQLRVSLKLKEKSDEASDFQVQAETENMSRGGFLCTCSTSLQDPLKVEVILCSDNEYYLGEARLVRVVKNSGLGARYAFQFTQRVPETALHS